MSAPILRRTRDGRTLCVPHATSGLPTYHTPGCSACELARANGIVRKDISTVPKKRRGGEHLRHRWIDWDLVRKVKAARGET